MLAAGTSLGPYKVVAPLGAGGMGEVYRAHDARLGRDVAVKVIHAGVASDPDRIKRFQQEARAAGALNHPNVCGILDIGTHEGLPFVVMELLEGETLREKLRAGALPARKAADYVAQAARGLAAAHEKGIVHRDLKPENLFVTGDGRLKVLDFGLAKLTRPAMLDAAGEPPASLAPTETGAILGTAGYMAPEQVLGKAADARSDLFSLGAILYELLTGRRAFHGGSHVETLHAILNDEPEPLAASGREVPPRLARIVEHCLEKDPEKRWHSAKDLAFDLEGFAGGGSSHPALEGRASRGRSRVVAITVAACAVAATLLAVGGLIALRAWRALPEPPRFTRLTFQRGAIGNARFAADGKGVVYSAAWEGRPFDVFETQADLSTTRSLGLTGTILYAVSRTSDLALGRSTTTFYSSLAVVPASGSAPRDLMSDVSAADWSPDGKALAVVRRAQGEDRLEMPPGHVLVSTSGQLSDVRVSPDGQRVAFVEHSVLFDTRGAAAVVDLAGRRSVLTREYPGLVGLAWSPNGREVWFSAAAHGVQQSLMAVTLEGRLRTVARFPANIVLKDVGPDGRVLLTSVSMRSGVRGRYAADTKERELGWLDFSYPRALSADGRLLLLDDQGETGGPSYTVYLRRMDGSLPVRLGQGSGCALSPDGRWALAIQYGSPHRLMLIPTGTGDTLSLPRGRVETYQFAHWLPDGRLVFVGAEPGRPQRTWVQRLPRGLPSPVTPEGTVGSRPSPDGRWVAAVTADSTLVLYPLQEGKPRTVGRLAAGEGISEWSKDGRTLFVPRVGTSLDVFQLDVQTGVKRLWRSFDVPDPAGFVAATFLVTPDGRSYAYGYLRLLSELYLAEGLK